MLISRFIPPAFAADPIVKPLEANTFCALNTLFANVVSKVAPLAGIVLFIMLVWGGFSYLTSGGDPKQTEQAKNTITYAVVGILLLILAWFTLVFIGTFTDQNVTSFQIPC